MLLFYGLANGKRTLLFGKITKSSSRDLSFKSYSRRRTFSTILNLYRTRGLSNQECELIFDKGSTLVKTDAYGAFWCEDDFREEQNKLVSAKVVQSGRPIRVIEGLYSPQIQQVQANTIFISDIDDTILHSFISKKFLQVTTLLFTTVEKRRAVEDMASLMKRLYLSGAEPFYLSNSEQNLYPLLYRFLMLNEFPPGPLFLKQYKRLTDFIFKRGIVAKGTHKLNVLEKLMKLFSNKKFVLVGDNTQLDLKIYLAIAEKYPENILHIIIRKVHEKPEDVEVVTKARQTLSEKGISLTYESSFSEDLSWTF